MFNREGATYAVDPEAVERILADETNPLHRVSEVIPDGSTVLDIGAGNGLLAAVLQRAHSGITIDAIEPSADAAEIARSLYRSFEVGYAQDYLEQISSGGYDFIVLADVIEHVADPLAFLQELAAAMPDDARLLISVPNVAFAALRMSLLGGRFDYVDSGLLERTHLRFFTLATLEKVFDGAGLRIERRVLHKKGAFQSEIELKPSLLDLVTLARLRRDSLAATYQFFFVLTKSGGGEPVYEEYGSRTTYADLARNYIVGKRRPR